MARRGDGIYLRGKTWWLDLVHRGKRHVSKLGEGNQPDGRRGANPGEARCPS